MPTKTYRMQREITGYVRCYQYVEVEADSLEEAMEKASSVATDEDIEICRDDRETGEWYRLGGK